MKINSMYRSEYSTTMKVSFDGSDHMLELSFKRGSKIDKELDLLFEPLENFLTSHLTVDKQIVIPTRTRWWR